MTDQQRLASVSLDVDDLWSYMKTHGDAGWEARPSYYDVFFPIVLEVLEKQGLRITFFIVGRDAAREDHHPILRSVIAAGHEVGNHSYEHEPWLHKYSREQLVDEISRAESAILAATGQRTIGFRGPGYSWSPTLLEVLADRGYLFDASSLPTYLGPLARAYYFWTAKLSREERATRNALFGTVRDGLRPVAPYRWQLAGDRQLLEIPVTTMPLFKVPFHVSYLLYLSRWSEALAVAHLRTGLALCAMAGVEPSILLHPLDLLGCDQAPALRFFPGMELSGHRKEQLFSRFLGIIGERYQIVPMSVHAHAILSRPAGIRVIAPAHMPAPAAG